MYKYGEIPDSGYPAWFAEKARTLEYVFTTNIASAERRTGHEPPAADSRIRAIRADGGNHTAGVEQSRRIACKGRPLEGSGGRGECHGRRECSRALGVDHRGQHAAAERD